jgi:methionyl aminopeptidase
MTHKKPEETKKDSGLYTGPLRPYPYSFKGHRAVPDHIKRPDYARSGKPSMTRDNVVPIVSELADIEKLRKACRIAR